MTLKIEVTVPQDIIEAQGAGLYLGNVLSAIGFSAAYGTAVRGAVFCGSGAVLATAEGAETVSLRMTGQDEAREAEREASDEMSKRACVDEAREAAKERMAEQVQDVVKRKRRTKAEIEADNAKLAAELNDEPKQPNISTGAERIDPANPEDAAQDAADEAAEAEKVKAAAGGKLTHDDVRSALKGYVTAFGMQAAMEDGPKVITLVVGEGKVKVSDIPDDQDVLAKVIAGIEEMTAKNPFNRTAA